MDFYRIRVSETKTGLELYPDFIIGRSKDLMVQGRTFYAIWDEERGLWSRDEYDVQRLVDEDLTREAERLQSETGVRYSVRYMSSFGSNSWKQFRKFLAHVSDNHHPLDNKLIFANQEVKKTDYATHRLPYALEAGMCPAWEELLETLYAPEERRKIEWAIGAVISGDAKKIQKFLVFHGSAGTGKSTVLGVIERLFEGYTTTFDGKALGSANGQFATEVFKHGPLVAIQHDGDLSKLEDNARLNSIISHEMMTMNEKYKPSYTARVDAFLFMGSNQPVKISDAKSGIIRRLIDVHPTGNVFGIRQYQKLMSQVEFELGAIAWRCLETYRSLGKNYFNGYRPLEMMYQTDVFFNFMEAHYGIFQRQECVTLKQAYSLYKQYCSETGVERSLPQYKIREELRNYFDEYRERYELNGETLRSVFVGFRVDKFKSPPAEEPVKPTLVLDQTDSLLDRELSDCPAQLAKVDGTPRKPWAKVTTVLADIDTSKLHYVQVPDNHIVIDFDLKDENGEKALDRNLAAAGEWPETYGELSKSGSGVHLHYLYSGDLQQLQPGHSDGVEVKVYNGGSALRRQLRRCNATPIATISSGLPLKQKQEKMLKSKTITSEKGLRELIKRNLRKEIHPGTKPSVDFIKQILDEAHESGMTYDVTDLQPRIMAFANNSSNQARAALKVVAQMKWQSEDNVEKGDFTFGESVKPKDDRLVFFDVEVYPNLFVICWKYQDTDDMVVMINPAPHEVEALFIYKLVGFYNRKYDNHILYAAALGASNAELFKLSQKLIVDSNRRATFGAAYNLSYADIYDFSSEKMSLKKFEIKLGILHVELDLPWDEPVDEKDWPRVVEYCSNDVRATEAVFNDRKGDFTARLILAEMSGLTPNDTTQAHTAKIIFGDVRNPQRQFVYTDLSTEFPGYTFERGKSSYRGEDPGEGGYVYAEPGLYENVAVFDVVSMHPTSMEVMNMFGPYTAKFSELRAARVAIKHGDFESVRAMLGGRLAPLLQDESSAAQLAYALKIVINSVYGLTSAKFENPFRDPRNVDNIAAKRGALFMIDLKHYLQDAGYKVIHIKTDSVKVPNADERLSAKILAFGQQFGYEFEREETYDRFALVNDAVYVGGIQNVPWEEGFPKFKWHATGAQFAHPYVFKKLFTNEQIVFGDMCEARSVNKGTMYLLDPEDNAPPKHVGRTGLFVPVLESGRQLCRLFEEKYFAVSGTKGWLWMEADVAAHHPDVEIDKTYFEKLVENAIATIQQHGSFEDLVQ